MVTILFLAANPIGTCRLRLDEEIRSIDQALLQTEYRDRIQIEQQWAVQVTDLQRHFLRYKPDIVHFSGHGSDASEIYLEDSSGTAQAVPAHALSDLFSVLKGNIKCVVLNACYSEQQAQAIAQHIDCVVGMSDEIDDQAAISFASSFYQALGFGEDLKTAFNLGCNQIDLANIPQHNIPKLLAKKVDPSKIIPVSSSEMVPDRISTPPETPPDPNLKLKLYKMGRDRSLHDVIEVNSNMTIPHILPIGFALVNQTASSKAKDISIRIDISWRGDQISKGPSFKCPTQGGWHTQVMQIVHEQPAALVFNDANQSVFYDQPVEWGSFRITFQEVMNGYLQFNYKISSGQPLTSTSGELRLFLRPT